MRDILGRLPLFSGLPAGPLAELASLAHARHLAPGEVLFHEGDSGDDVYVVISGRVRISKRVALGTERTLALLDPGSMFGEAAIIDQEERSATAVALTDAELAVLDAEPLREWLIANAEHGVMVLGRLGAMMLERLRSTNEQVREAIAWGVEVSGAARYGLDQLVTERRDVQLQLLTGRVVDGRIVGAEEGPTGLELSLADDDGRLHRIPYRSIAELVVEADLAVAHPPVEP